MKVSRVIFERGLEISRAQNSLKMPGNDMPLSVLMKEVAQRFRVRPIVLSEQVAASNGSGEEERHSVFSPTLGTTLSMRLSNFDQDWPVERRTALFYPIINAQYTVGAMIYHCQQLAILYATIAERYAMLDKVIGQRCAHVLFQGQSEAYFEFDALITAARRSYDCLRYILWSLNGIQGSLPSNLVKTVDKCTEVPNHLLDRIRQSWLTFGEKLTAYRDCIQHYQPVSFGFDSASLTKLDCGTWSVLIRIPDNPEAKSRSHFAYTEGLDALSFGWELADEIVTVTEVLFTEARRQSDSARPQLGPR